MKRILLLNDLPTTSLAESSAPRSIVSYLLPESLPRWTCTMLLCAAASWGGLLLGQTRAQADILWPPNGILLAFLLVRPRRFWASYLAGGLAVSLLVHELFGFPIASSWIYSFANTVEVLLAALLLAPEDQRRPDLTRIRTLARFVLFGVLLAPLASACVVELILTLQGRPSSLLGIANWFVGDVVGIAIMTPLVLAIEQQELASLFSPARRAETVALLAGVTLLSWGIFFQRGLPIGFLVFPLLLLVIFRLGASGAAIAVFLMAAPAAWFTAMERGPFAPLNNGSLIHSIFLFQCFLVVALVTLYSVSAALAERDRLQQELTAAYRVADASAALDHMTGLANRRAFDRHLEREWRRASRDRGSLSLMMIDVDQFKLYNDHYGHLAGDLCLRAVGEVLASAPLRSTDLAARYGGEEFAIILPGAGLEGATILAEKIRQSVADRGIPHLPYLPGIVTISMGVATMLPADHQGLWDETRLIEWADQALYLAKKNGRNLVQTWDGVSIHP